MTKQTNRLRPVVPDGSLTRGCIRSTSYLFLISVLPMPPFGLFLYTSCMLCVYSAFSSVAIITYYCRDRNTASLRIGFGFLFCAMANAPPFVLLSLGVVGGWCPLVVPWPFSDKSQGNCPGLSCNQNDAYSHDSRRVTVNVMWSHAGCR